MICASLALLQPLLSLTHWIFRLLMLPYKSSSHSAKCVRCASDRSGGRRLAVRTAMEHHIGVLPRTPFPASRDFPSRGNEKIGGTGYCVTYDTDSQSRNVLASPLGEEGHEVAKGVQANWIHRGAPRPANPVRRHPAKSVWTRERMIMIRYGDVTAERRHYNTLRPIGRYRNPQRRRRCRPPERSEHNLPPSGGHNLRAKGACPLGPDPDLASRTR